ncbi:MAG: hypothetical protein HYZ28_10835 [Myxococcales bacterium]|nr:hypothetical protein [Myxococcales bacterium]
MPALVGCKREAAPPVWVPMWRQASSLSVKRAGTAAVIANGHLVVIGGVDGKDFLPSTEIAEIRSDSSLGPWKPGPPMNEPRGFFDAVVHEGRIYVVGGGKGPHGHVLLRTVEHSRILPDGHLSPWETAPEELNVPRRCCEVVLEEGTLYTLGGFGGDMLNTVEHAAIRPDGGVDEWFEEEERLTSLRYISGVKNVGGTTYVVGGHDQQSGLGLRGVERGRVADQAGFGRWTSTSPLLAGRYGLAVAAHGGRLYALGGISGVEYLDSIEVATVSADGGLESWRPVSTRLPVPLAMFEVQVQGDWIYAIGGTNRAGYSTSVYFARFNEAGEIGSWATKEEAEAFKAFPPKASEAERPLPNEGVVAEVVPAPKHVYLRVAGKGGQVWLSAPAGEFSPGDRIRYGEGVLMQDFYSKELKREFPEILMVGKVQKEGSANGGRR